MADETYLHFIAYYMKNYDKQTTSAAYRKLFQSVLKTDIFTEATTARLKELALRFYYRFVLYQYIRNIPNMETTATRLFLLIKDLEEFYKNHDLSVNVVYYLDQKEAIKHMESLSGPIELIKQLENIEVKKPARSAPTKTTTKTTTKKPVKSATTKHVTKSTSKSTSEESTSEASKSEESERSNEKSKEKVKLTKIDRQKKCQDYTVKELKQLAQERNIVGGYKMNKAELCKALRIKA